MAKKFFFEIKYKPSQIFELIIDNLKTAEFLIATLKVKRIKFTISATSLLANIIQTLKVKRIKFTISSIGILQRLPMTVKVKPIKFTAIMHLLEGWTQEVKIKRIKLTVILQQLLRVGATSLIIKKIRLTVNPTVATFYTLSHWDPYYLSNLDGEYLADLDYQIIT